MGLGLETGFAQTGCLTRAWGMFLAVMSAGIVAFLAAQMGSKALLALAGGILVVGCVVRARDKSLFMVFLTVCSLVFLLHKSFGPQDLTLSGGAPAVYVTSFDALLLLLYGLWVSEGTFRRRRRGPPGTGASSGSRSSAPCCCCRACSSPAATPGTRCPSWCA